jgi:hypothetical protein
MIRTTPLLPAMDELLAAKPSANIGNVVAHRLAGTLYL